MSGLRDWAGRVAVVTGGASGIGLGIVRSLVARGAQVVVVDIEQAPLDTVVAELDDHGVVGEHVDVTDADAVARLATDVMRRFGRIDLLCNNAGVSILRPMSEFTLEDFRWMIDINTMGVVNGLVAFLPHLRSNPHGAWILNTSSAAALMPSSGMGAYVLSKSGVAAMTEVLAEELHFTGVGASVLVPALVRSNIATGQRNRPGFDTAALNAGMNDDYLPSGRMLEADQVGELAIAAIERGDLYVITHPELAPLVQRRHAAIESAIDEAGERERAERTDHTA